MTTPNWQARRATIEDLQKLVPLWQQGGLPAEELGKRLQEFQVVEANGGELVGAVGFQIAGGDARLHHECFASASEADAVRAKLWERVQMISKNHGLLRLWTQCEAPFWSQNGFQAPAPEIAAKLPAAFAGAAQPWGFIQLREDIASSPDIEKEFAMFKELQQEERERSFEKAKRMKLVALLAVLLVFLIFLICAVIWLKTPLHTPLHNR